MLTLLFFVYYTTPQVKVKDFDDDGRYLTILPISFIIVFM